MFAPTIVHEREVFENERFSPMSGWSAKGLLITDRRAFSTRDGSISWSSLEQAEEALLSYGWEWDKDSTWVVDINFPNTDADGWSYDVNFGSFESASATKGMMHFVRRRRRTRNVKFIANTFFTGTCDHVDLSERDRISSKLLLALATVSSRQGTKGLAEPKMNQLKNKLLELVNLSPNSERMPIFSLHARIDSFSENTMTMWSQASSSMSQAFSKDDRQETLQTHIQELDAHYFLADERAQISTILIRKHDTQNEFHCSKTNCGSECVFAPMNCPNEGCVEVFSRKWSQAHDEKCPHKIVDCKRACGDRFPRRLMENHLHSACPLRPVFCPFNDMGCNVTELTHRDLPQHMETCSQSHLLLLLSRVSEHQSVIVSNRDRVSHLEVQSAGFAAAIAGMEAQIINHTNAIEGLERRLTKSIREDIAAAEKRLGKTDTSIQHEMSNVKTSVSRLHQELEAFKQAVRKP